MISNLIRDKLDIPLVWYEYMYSFFSYKLDMLAVQSASKLYPPSHASCLNQLWATS